MGNKRNLKVIGRNALFGVITLGICYGLANLIREGVPYFSKADKLAAKPIIKEKEISLDGLGLKISVPGNISYFYEGYSPDVNLHHEKITRERYGLKVLNPNPKNSA